jgi:hypothetical protein
LSGPDLRSLEQKFGAVQKRSGSFPTVFDPPEGGETVLAVDGHHHW